MNVGSRIFEIISVERKRQADRWQKAERDLARLLSEYDLVQSATLMASPSTPNSSTFIPGFIGRSELSDLSTRGPDRMRSIERMTASLAERRIQEALENGEHLAHIASLILDHDRGPSGC